MEGRDARGKRFINAYSSLIEISESVYRARSRVGNSNFNRKKRISRVSIKGRAKRKDKVSTPISILVSKRVFNRRHARTCIANDMSASRWIRGGSRASCTRVTRRRARIFSRCAFASFFFFFFFIENVPRDANLFTFERIQIVHHPRVVESASLQ